MEGVCHSEYSGVVRPCTVRQPPSRSGDLQSRTMLANGGCLPGVAAKRRQPDERRRRWVSTGQARGAEVLRLQPSNRFLRSGSKKISIAGVTERRSLTATGIRPIYGMCWGRSLLAIYLMQISGRSMWGQAGSRRSASGPLSVQCFSMGRVGQADRGPITRSWCACRGRGRVNGRE